MSFTITDRRAISGAKPTPPRDCYGITRIVSGAQTGVDRAALDAARQLGLAHGGWVPAGRLAEDGVIPIEYQMRECLGGNAERTALNVRDSDATLLISHGPDTHFSCGTKLTKRLVAKQKKGSIHARLPMGRIELIDERTYEQLRAWIARCRIKTLNVAGPRESKEPGIYADALAFLVTLLAPKEIA